MVTNQFKKITTLLTLFSVISGGFRLVAAKNFAIQRSIIDTAIKNGHNVLFALTTITNYK